MREQLRAVRVSCCGSTDRARYLDGVDTFLQIIKSVDVVEVYSDDTFIPNLNRVSLGFACVLKNLPVLRNDVRVCTFDTKVQHAPQLLNRTAECRPGRCEHATAPLRQAYTPT